MMVGSAHGRVLVGCDSSWDCSTATTRLDEETGWPALASAPKIRLTAYEPFDDLPCHTKILPASCVMNTLNFFPQPMEIAFSLDAGAFSSDLFDVNPVVGPDQLLRNATVICFENVLIPFKWMTQQLGLRPTVKGVQEAKERAMRIPYLQEPLARIEQFALQLLTTISSRGPVCILSEQSARFVEILCQVFFPRLAYCLSNPQVLPNVQVIGAPKRFVTTSEKAMWRISIMQSLVRDRLFAGNSYLLADATAGRFGLIVVSPHNIDTVACSKALEVAPFLVPKSVRVANARNLPLDQFAVHLQTMTQYLSEAAPCLTPFAVSV